MVPPHAKDKLESTLEAAFNVPHDSCFVRHKHSFIMPRFMDRHGIPYKIVRQTPGEMVVLSPDAYHWGLNVGHNIAEAVNAPLSNEIWKEAGYKSADLKNRKKCIRQFDKAFGFTGNLFNLSKKDLGHFVRNLSTSPQNKKKKISAPPLPRPKSTRVRNRKNATSS